MKWKWLVVAFAFVWNTQIRAGSLLDTTFQIGTGANGLVEQVLELPSGKVLVCGNFTTFNEQNRSYIARLNNDGSVDLSFEAHPSYWVRHMSVQPDGKIVIGGYFTAVEDVPRNLIARLNEDGSLDTTFDPGAGAEDIIAGGIDGNITPFVFWMEIQEDGKIIITGNFRKYDGASRVGLARLNPEGSLDETFDVGSGLDSWGRVIKLSAGGDIYIGGWFNNYNNHSANRLVRLHEDGTIDPDFHPYYGDATSVYSIVELSNGQLITSGHARDEDSPFHREVVRLNHDGSVDTSWYGSTNEKTETLLLLPGEELLLGGYFSEVNGQPRTGVGRLNPDGTLETNFFVRIDNFVWTIAPGQNQKVYISGGFTSVDGNPRNGVARLVLPESGGPISTPPPKAPRLQNARIEDHKFRINVPTTPGYTYILEAADSPFGPWQELLSVRALQSSITFEDTSVEAKQFYRVHVE